MSRMVRETERAFQEVQCRLFIRVSIYLISAIATPEIGILPSACDQKDSVEHV